MMRILMAAAVPKKREGGAAVIAYNLGEQLERRGHTVSYIFLEDLIVPGSVRHRYSEFIFAKRLARYISQNREKLSLVNLHAPTGFIYGLHRRFLGAPGPPYVATLHGLEENRPHVMRREHRKGRAWNFSFKNHMWHRYTHMPRYDWALRTADAVHCYGRFAWNYVRLKHNLDDERLAYIPNGVAERFFVPREYPAADGVKLLYAGTWLDQRGIFYIRDALRKLAPRLPGLTMTFAGCGASAETIQQFFGEELKGRIIVQPVVDYARMQELYSQHDIFLFPSMIEGLPSVVLEAMATGMPVITAEACGVPDVVEHDFNGILVPPANAEAIEEAVLRLAGSLELRKKLGEAARQTMKRYTWERSGQMLENLFLRVIAAEKRKTA